MAEARPNPSPPWRPTCSTAPSSEDQRLIRDAVAEFAAEQFRDHASQSDTWRAAPVDLVAEFAELGPIP